MLTVFTKETAGGKFRQFLKLIMLLFTVQFFHPVLLQPVCIFSIYSGDNDDSSHLHIAFHLKAPRLPPLFLSFLPPSLAFPSSLSFPSSLPSFFFSLDCCLQPSVGQQKMQSATFIHWSVRRRETPKQTLKEEAERIEGEENSTCCHACLEEGLAQGPVFSQ